MHSKIPYSKMVIICILVLFIGTNILPSTVSHTNFSSGSNSSDEPFIELTINSPLFDFESMSVGGNTFASLELLGEGFTTVIGEARLPVIRQIVEIPSNSIPKTVEVRSSTWKSTSLSELDLPARILPVQPSAPKAMEILERAEFALNERYYSNNIFMQTDIAKISKTGAIRERCFAIVEISPVQYNPSSGELNLMDTCEIRINLQDDNKAQNPEKLERYDSPAFEKLFETLFINYIPHGGNMGGASKGTEAYLVIAYDSFYEEILPLANWKKSIGYNVTVTNTSDIPGGASKENIKTYIRDAYDNWTVPPTYVLLVGDTVQIPTYTGSSSFSAADLYYVTMNPEDYFPDIFIGRFPASQESHVTAMVNKTVYYEQGSFPSGDWIKKAVFMASDDHYYVTEETHNYVIDHYLDPNGYVYDKLYCHTYGATTQQVKDALNDGRSLSIYSGHGSIYSWGDGPSFTQSDVRGLTNQGMYPFVCSHSCKTNTFTSGECFGETWVREQDKGALAFWGASANTFWPEDDILEKKTFSSWWDDNLETIGGMTDMGLYYLYLNYGGGGQSRYYFECYNLLGDPSVKIWRNDPNPPIEISNIQAIPQVQETSGWVNISCNATADAGLNFANVNITYPDDSTVSQPMVNIPGTDDYYFNNTYLLSGMYSYHIWAKDTGNNENTSETHYFYIGVSVVNIQLKTGWNLITVPVENSYTAMTLSENITGCLSVSNWDSTNQTYKRYIVGGPPDFDFPIKDGCGYFVDADQDSTLTLSGAPVPGVNIPLRVGWNLIGWYHDHDTTAISLSENISGCSSVSMWDNNVHQTYKRYIVGGPPDFDFTITQGKGLFVDVTSESIWHGEG